MRKIFFILLASALAGCAENTAVLQGLCKADAVVVPLTVTVGTVAATASGEGVLASAAATMDGTVHPAVQSACAALGGTATAQ